MKKTVILVSFALFILLFITTCELLPTDPPTASFDSVDLTGITFNGVQMLAKVKVENPNAVKIPFPEIDWKLALNGSLNSFIDGKIRNNEYIKANDYTIVDVPFSFEFLEVINTFTSLKGESSVPFKFNFDIKFDIPVIGQKVFNLEKGGDVPLPQLPELSLPSLSVSSYSMIPPQLTVDLSMDINNKNTFALPAPDINLNLKINNKSFANSKTETAILSKNEITPYTTSFTVNALDGLSAIISSLLAGNSISTDLTSTIDFKIPVFDSPENLEWKNILLKN